MRVLLLRILVAPAGGAAPIRVHARTPASHASHAVAGRRNGTPAASVALHFNFVQQFLPESSDAHR